LLTNSRATVALPPEIIQTVSGIAWNIYPIPFAGSRLMVITG
jgi:hypothetical protein